MEEAGDFSRLEANGQEAEEGFARVGEKGVPELEAVMPELEIALVVEKVPEEEIVDEEERTLFVE